jgi:hypothetical protein
LNFSNAKFFLTLVFRKLWIAFPAIFMSSLKFFFQTILFTWYFRNVHFILSLKTKR